MSDFAKTILGFGPFSKREATPPNYSDDLAPPLPQVLHHAPNEPHGSSKFLPKNLASTPTTAVSSQSLAYGTTTLLAEQNSSQGQKPGAFLSDLLPYYSNDPQQSHFGANVSAAQEQQHHLLQQQHHYGTMTGAEVEKAAALKSEYELGVAKGVSSSTSSARPHSQSSLPPMNLAMLKIPRRLRNPRVSCA